MTPDDWGMDDRIDPADPETAAREQRRREREARRAERAEGNPPSPEHPGATASEGTAEQPQAVPPPDQRLPSTPAREPFAQRAAAMRRRLGGSGPRRRPPDRDAAQGGGGGRPTIGRRVPTAVAVIALLALAGVVAVGAAAVIDRVGGDEPPPQATLRVENVTIPEGLARAQIAEITGDAGLRGNYMKASVSARGFDPGKYGAGSPRNLEGFLFPATYELERNTNVRDLVGKQLDAFETNMAGVDMSYARSKNLTVYDVLIIASMIEREVQIPRERKLVAAVIYNRLRGGMPLGIDATTRFAVGNYTKPLTNEELASPSPYNTRLVAGLPPGPIGNPGLDSIEAAANPAKVDYIYYVVKPGTCGEHNFSSNDADFARDREAYQQALEAQGGSPDTC